MTNRIVTSKHTFNNGVLLIEFKIIDYYADSELSIDHVDFYEFNTDAQEYELLDTVVSEEESQTDFVRRYNIILNNAENHLVKCRIFIDPKDVTNPPCCANIEDGLWVAEDFVVDMSIYERKILDSINLGCGDNCNVPIGTINNLLKLFAVKAAVDSNSPLLEMIFSKIACSKTNNMISTSFSRNCNCNG